MAEALLQRGEVLWRNVFDGVLVRVRGDDEPVLLTGSGVSLWRSLAEPVAMTDLVDRLAVEHQTDTATVASDIEPVVADLLRRGVVIAR